LSIRLQSYQVKVAIDLHPRPTLQVLQVFRNVFQVFRHLQVQLIKDIGILSLGIRKIKDIGILSIGIRKIKDIGILFNHMVVKSKVRCSPVQTSGYIYIFL
jgi:hypothetical protein